MRLNTTPVATDSASVNIRIGRLRTVASIAGMEVGTSRAISRMASGATSSPSAPPNTARTTPSTTICCASRRSVAPSETRTVSSPRRLAARTTSRLARFAHAIRSTHAAAAIRTSSSSCTSPSRSVLIGTTAAPMCALVAGYCVASCAATRCMSACACATVTPGASRATTLRKWEPRRAASSGVIAIGAQKSRSRLRNTNPRGMTPMTVRGAPFIRTARPTIAGSPPKRRCQSP